MGFLNEEMILKQVENYLDNESSTVVDLIVLGKTSILRSLRTLNKDRMSFNYRTDEIKIRSYFDVATDSLARTEWAVYNLLFSRLSFAKDVKVGVILVPKENEESRNLVKDECKCTAIGNYICSIWQLALQKVKKEFEEETFEIDEIYKFCMSALRVQCVADEIETPSFGAPGVTAEKFEEICAYTAIMRKAYEAVPSRMVEYLETYLI